MTDDISSCLFMLYLSDIFVFWAASKDFKESGEGCISPAKGMVAAYMCDSDQDTPVS